MNETNVTLRGYVGGKVNLRQAGDSLVANFRIGCTPRRFSRKSNEWKDEETQWYTINAWRQLGENCEASLQIGDPVVVHGRLSVRTFVNSNNVEQITLEVEAVSVGHDLHRGTSAFTKTVRPEQAASEASEPRQPPEIAQAADVPAA